MIRPPSPTVRPAHRPRVALALLFVLVAVGCAHRQPLPIPEEPQVRTVKFEGNKKLSAMALRDSLGTRVTPWWARTVPLRRYWIPLDRNRIGEDRLRIERFYEAMGFFDASAPGHSIQYKGKEIGEGHRWAVVQYAVLEGDRALVRRVNVKGLGDLDAQVREAIDEALTLGEGEPFALPEHEADRAAIERALMDSGYAYARVERQADAYPEELAVDLSYRIEPGIRCVFDEVRIVGLAAVPLKRVEREVSVEPGERYSLARLRKVQADIYGMGVFSMVTVAPDLSNPENDRIRVLVSVREARPIALKFGAGLGLERGRDDAHVSFSFAHDNLFGQLVQFRSHNRVGWALVPDLLHPDLHGPIVEGNLELTEPTHLRTVKFRQWGAFDVDVEQGYKYLSPSAGAGLDWHIHRSLTAGIAYNIEYFWLYWKDPELFSSLTPYTLPEIDNDGIYWLSYLEQHLTWDARNDILTPSRGAFARLSVAEAGIFLGGGFDYVKLAAEARAYVDPVPQRLVFAFRVQFGRIWLQGDTLAAPMSHKFKLGGSSSVRGWGRDQLGPRWQPQTCSSGASCFPDEEEANQEDDDQGQGFFQWPGRETEDEEEKKPDPCSKRDCRPIATGGHLMLAAGVELRAFPARLGRSARLGFALFLDAGRVWDNPTSFAWADLMLSTGLGPRVQTSFGTFRLDLAFRLNRDEEAFPSDPMVALHFGLSEAF